MKAYIRLLRRHGFRVSSTSFLNSVEALIYVLTDDQLLILACCRSRKIRVLARRELRRRGINWKTGRRA